MKGDIKPKPEALDGRATLPWMISRRQYALEEKKLPRRDKCHRRYALEGATRTAGARKAQSPSPPAQHPATHPPCICDQPVGRVLEAVHFHHGAQPPLLLIHQLLQAEERGAGRH